MKLWLPKRERTVDCVAEFDYGFGVALHGLSVSVRLRLAAFFFPDKEGGPGSGVVVGGAFGGCFVAV